MKKILGSVKVTYFSAQFAPKKNVVHYHNSVLNAEGWLERVGDLIHNSAREKDFAKITTRKFRNQDIMTRLKISHDYGQMVMLYEVDISTLKEAKNGKK